MGKCRDSKRWIYLSKVISFQSNMIPNTWGYQRRKHLGTGDREGRARKVSQGSDDEESLSSIRSRNLKEQVGGVPLLEWSCKELQGPTPQ